MGDVLVTVKDQFGGSIVAPLSGVQLVLGVCSGGTVGQFVVARGIGGPSTLTSTCGYGPGVEAASLACLAGATVIFAKTATKTKGTASAVTAGAGNTGLTVLTITVDGTQGAFDDGLFLVKCVTAGTIGTSASIQISGDAGRTFGPIIALGTATTHLISNMGVTLNFTVATIAVGDTYTFATYAPSSDPTDTNGGIKEVLDFFAASPYAVTGVGSVHVVGGKDGTQCMKGWSYSDAHLIEGYLDTLATAQVFERILLSTRDASPAAKWGGTGESEATWYGALNTDYAGPADRRLNATAGYYNMPSAITNADIGGWIPRRSLQWAHACRVAQNQLKTLSSRVSDGALTEIDVNVATDPLDGFIYHDDRVVPVWDSISGAPPPVKLTGAKTYIGQGVGYFISEPWLLSPNGSDFVLLPHGRVMDAVCTTVHAVALNFLNEDVRLNPDGTIFENDARSAEHGIKGAIDSAYTATNQISSCSVQVDRTTNVQTSHKFVITVAIVARGYDLDETITVGFGA